MSPAEGASAENREHTTDGPHVIVTNRSNLVDFLSSGLLRPRDAMVKYYDDTLSLTSGRIPVIHTPIPDELVDLCESEAGNFVVLLELDPDRVHPSADPRIGYLEVDTLDAVRAAHLRSEAALAELTSRRFDNADFSRLAYRVSPELFGGEEPTAQAVRAAVEPGADRNFAAVDRRGGARLLALQAAPHTADGLSRVGHLVFAPAPEPTDSSFPVWLDLARDLREYKPRSGAGYDERIFLAAAAVCITADRRDAWDGLAALDAVTALVSEDPDLPGADLERWNRAIGRMRRYLLALEPFVAFEPAPFSSEKALLLTLVRADVTDVLAWREESIAADEWDLTVAAILSGLRHGRISCPTDIRPTALDRRLADLERDELLDRAPEGAEVKVETRMHDGTPELALSVDGEILFTVPAPARTAVELLDALDGPAEESRLAELARERGWTDVIRTTVRIPGAFEHTGDGSASRISIVGDVEVTVGVQLDILRRRLAEHDDEELRDALIAMSEPESTDETEAGRTEDGQLA